MNSLRKASSFLAIKHVTCTLGINWYNKELLQISGNLHTFCVVFTRNGNYYNAYKTKPMENHSMKAAEWTNTNWMAMLTVIFAFYLPEFLTVSLVIYVEHSLISLICLLIFSYIWGHCRCMYIPWSASYKSGTG